MKKILSFVLAIIVLFVMCGCGCDHIYDSGTITVQPTCTTVGVKTLCCTKCDTTISEELPVISHAYVNEVIKNPSYKEEGEMKFTCSSCGDNYVEAIPVVEPEVIINVTEKEDIHKDTSKWIFSDYVRLTVEVENISNNSIKGVQGVLHIKDMFGEEFMKTSCDLTDKEIPANKIIEFTELYLDINQFFSEQVKFFNTDFDDLIFEYEVTNIIFTN